MGYWDNLKTGYRGDNCMVIMDYPYHQFKAFSIDQDVVLEHLGGYGRNSFGGKHGRTRCITCYGYVVCILAGIQSRLISGQGLVWFNIRSS